jgi:hypothetical protein
VLQGRWLRGIIDQLQLGDDGRLAVVEHKTRARPTLPRPAQARLFFSPETVGVQGPPAASWPPYTCSCGRHTGRELLAASGIALEPAFN